MWFQIHVWFIQLYVHVPIHDENDVYTCYGSYSCMYMYQYMMRMTIYMYVLYMYIRLKHITGKCLLCDEAL